MAGPFSTQRKQGFEPSRSRDRIDQQDYSEKTEKKDIPKKNLGKVANELSQQAYIMNQTWPFLKKEFGRTIIQMTVSEYYFRIKVAVDKFFSDQEFAEGDIELKKKLLNENGIKYVALGPRSELASVQAQLESQ